MLSTVYNPLVVDIKFNENPCSGSRVVTYGRTGGPTERRDEADSRLFEILRKRLIMAD